MMKKPQHQSLELLIHPGEILADILVERGYSLKEFALLTSRTEKYISSVINGQRRISKAFAKKLAHALNCSDAFWLNLQANYDQELFYLTKSQKK